MLAVTHAANPILSPGPTGSWDAGALGSMSVVQTGGVLHMYYEAWGVRGDSAADYRSLQIGHATSKDGISWTKDPANPVLRKGVGNEWDKDGVWDPFVLVENGAFKMWYGGGMDQHCDWGYAESKDGIHFEKKGRISQLGNVEDVHVVHDPHSRRYFMYYWDRAHEPMGLFCAVSTNETSYDFMNARNILIAGENYPNMYKFTHVVIEQGMWYMFYADFSRPSCAGSVTRCATSTNGIEWISRNKNVLVGHDAEVLKIADDRWHIYYGRQGYFDAKDSDIRMAISPMPIGKLADGDR